MGRKCVCPRAREEILIPQEHSVSMRLLSAMKGIVEIILIERV